jgi:hypothetical protein
MRDLSLMPREPGEWLGRIHFPSPVEYGPQEEGVIVGAADGEFGRIDENVVVAFLSPFLGYK